MARRPSSGGGVRRQVEPARSVRNVRAFPHSINQKTPTPRRSRRVQGLPLPGHTANTPGLPSRHRAAGAWRCAFLRGHARIRDSRGRPRLAAAPLPSASGSIMVIHNGSATGDFPPAPARSAIAKGVADGAPGRKHCGQVTPSPVALRGYGGQVEFQRPCRAYTGRMDGYKSTAQPRLI